MAEDSNNYYATHPNMMSRTPHDLKELAYFFNTSDKIQYGPNPIPSQTHQYNSSKNYKGLSYAYNADIKNDCLNRWDNDYMAWENRITKTGQGLK
jgi:hypothetical protein